MFAGNKGKLLLGACLLAAAFLAASRRLGRKNYAQRHPPRNTGVRRFIVVGWLSFLLIMSAGVISVVVMHATGLVDLPVNSDWDHVLDGVGTSLLAGLALVFFAKLYDTLTGLFARRGE